MFRTFSFFTTMLYKDFSAYTAQRLQELGLSFGALPFLVFVGKKPGCTPTELTKALRMDWGHSQRTITRLADGGFLTKEKSADGGRTYHLHLTEKGQKAFEVSHEVFYSWDEETLRTLSEEDRTRLLEILQKIREAKQERYEV